MSRRKKRDDGAGCVFRKRDDLWGAYIVGENGKRKYFYAKTKEKVLEKLDIAREEKRRGMLVVAPQQTLADYLAYWLEHCVKDTVRPRTYERYEEIVRLHIVPLLGKVKLQLLSPQHVQSLKSHMLKKKYAASSVGLVHVVLHKALSDAIRLGLVGRNVCDAVSPPREEQGEIKFLTLSQIQKLLEVARGHPLEPLLIVALTTGMRRGELLGLKWQDIDFSTGVLYVRRILVRVPSQTREEGGSLYVEAEPKTRSSRRSIVLVDFALDALKQHRVRQEEMKLAAGDFWEDRDYVFCTSLGKHLSPGSSVLEPFKVLLKKAGLPDMRFHDLRHSAATLLLSLGVHPKIVQEILGHSRIAMTLDTYSHALPTMQREAMDKLGGVFKKFFSESDEPQENGGENPDDVSSG